MQLDHSCDGVSKLKRVGIRLRVDEHYCSDRRSEQGIPFSVLERRSRLMTPQRPSWHELAEQASKELDPVRLMSLADELNRALEQNEKTSKQLQTQEFV